MLLAFYISSMLHPLIMTFNLVHIMSALLLFSCLDHKTPPLECHSGTKKQRRTTEQQAPTKYPQRIKSAMFLNRTSNGSTDQQPDSYNTEALAQSRADFVPRVGAQVYDDCWRQADKRTREKPIACHEHDETS